VEQHRKAVLATAYRALGNWDDAWDVTQEALIYGLTRLPQLRDYSRFGGWLKHITLSQCADYRRRRGTRSLGGSLDLLNEIAEETDYAGRMAVRQALEGLSDDHRATLLLHYAGGWSLDEVSGLLNIPVNTVRSRLMAAKRHLRADLKPIFEDKRLMPTKTADLADYQVRMIQSAFPKSRILSVQTDAEPWQPFSPRVTLALESGDETAVDFRTDITPDKAALLAVLAELGIPVPRIIASPVETGDGYATLLAPPAGENLSLWALGGTPHRIRLATERAFEAIDRLQGISGALMERPIGQALPRRTLADEAAALTSDEVWKAHPWLNWHESDVAGWRQDPWFATAAARVQDAVADIAEPLVYTNYMHIGVPPQSWFLIYSSTKRHIPLRREKDDAVFGIGDAHDEDFGDEPGDAPGAEVDGGDDEASDQLFRRV
jgi:RNA polymerase sigma-70 factor (ECF subfamily)